ncbi:CC125 protein, partial [Atractosteus spatula]|nr:CC125 protein [Atractosteus spatula]
MQDSGGRDAETGAADDDMTEGDLGDGLGRKPGGIYEQGVRSRAASTSSRTGSLGLVQEGAPKRSADHSGIAFQWTSYNTLYTVFRQGLDLSRPPPRWALDRKDSLGDLSKDALKQRLQELTEEVEVLRSELEVAQRQLEGKQEALKILQSRAVFDKATTHTKTLLQKSEERNKVLEKEVNALQWEITFNQVQFRNVEQSWKDKYDRVCSDNKSLGDGLEDKAGELRQVKSENAYLSQQCLELLAMLNVKEQKMFQGSLPARSSMVREGTALELAVLGACNCSTSEEEPCPCAQSAAASRKQVLQLRQELDVQKKRKEEAYVTADAFRIAFEQQLKRRSDQTFRLTETEGYLRKDVPRARKEEGGSLVKSGSLSVAQRLKGLLLSTAEGRKLEIQDDPAETLQMLVDLLNDKEEALAHQRKVSYMLARNSEELERRLRQMTDACPAGSSSCRREGSADRRSSDPGTLHPAATCKSCRTRQHSYVSKETLREKTGVQTETQREKTGVQIETQREKTGVQTETHREKTGVQTETQREKTGIQTETQTQSETPRDKTGIQTETSREKTGVQTETQTEKTGVQTEMQREKTGVQSETQTEKIGVQKNFSAALALPSEKEPTDAPVTHTGTDMKSEIQTQTEPVENQKEGEALI